MGGLLGAMAGGGMLALIGILVLLFLHQIRLLSLDTLRRIVRIASMVCAAGALYWGIAALLHQAVYQDLADPEKRAVLFHSAYLSRVYDAMQTPHWSGVLTGLFVYAAHGVGKLLFDQYAFAGAALAWGMTCVSACLLFSAIKQAFGDAAARDGVFLLLCLPGAVFFFLPGRAPAALLAISVALYDAVKNRLRPGRYAVSGSAYWVTLTVSGVLSAFVTSALVLERLA